MRTPKHHTSKDSGDFTLQLPSLTRWETGQILIAMLADIRREMRKTNATLERIESNTRPRARLMRKG